MTKNKMMRIASVLLVAVLLSTCAISGTFAKYVTEATGTDSARVAKWGVTINAGGAMFATEELAGDSATTVAKTALSSDTENIVAPGMDGTMAAIEISGTPEVAVKVTHEATVVVNGWAIAGDDFYCPLLITVDTTAINGLDYDTAAAFADAIKAAIDGHSKEYTAGTTLSSADNVDVQWSWAYAADGVNQTDAKDTLVADVTAEISITIRTVVTQID